MDLEMGYNVSVESIEQVGRETEQLKEAVRSFREY